MPTAATLAHSAPLAVLVGAEPLLSESFGTSHDVSLYTDFDDDELVCALFGSLVETAANNNAATATNTATCVSFSDALFASPSSTTSSLSPSTAYDDAVGLCDFRESSCNVGLLVSSRDADLEYYHLDEPLSHSVCSSSLSPLTPSSSTPLYGTTTTYSTTTTTTTPLNDYSPDAYSSPLAVPPTPQCTPTTPMYAVATVVVEPETTGVHAAKRRLAEQRRRGRLEKKALAQAPVLEREQLLNNLAKELLGAARAGDLGRVRTTLHAASNTGNHQLDADAHARLLGALDDTLGCTPLYYAVFYDHRDVAEYLLAQGADANARSRSGYSPLHWAVDKGHTELLAPLARYHADPNQLDAQGLAVVHHLVKRADLSLLSTLVSTFGTTLDLDLESTSLGSPLALATNLDLPEVVGFLLDAGATLVTLELAAMQSCSTAIHRAASQNHHRSLARLLLHPSAAVAINAVDNLGRTPLHYAAFFGKAEAADLLVAHNASLTVRDKRGLTAVDLAQRRSPHVYRRLVPST